MCFQISKPTLFPLGAWFLIFDSGSYDCVFGCSLLLFVIVSGLGIYKLWGIKVKMEMEKASLKD